MLIVTFSHRNPSGQSVLIHVVDNPVGALFAIGVLKMNLPSSLASWCVWLFFLWYGLAVFIPALNSDLFKKIAGVLAIGVFVFNVLGM
jgi:hypothetical protein